MSDELIEIVDNIKQPSVWIRVLFMIVFALASYIIILPLVLVLSIAQGLPEVEVDSLQEAPASRSERNKPPSDNSKAATPATKKAAANKSASIKPAKKKVAKKKAAKKSSAPIAASAKKVEDEGSAAS